MPSLAAIRMVVDFPDAQGGMERLVFTQAHRVCMAWRADQVADALAEVDAATRRGAWAVGYVAYEAAAAWLSLATPPAASSSVQPLVAFALFDAPDAAPDYAQGTQGLPIHDAQLPASAAPADAPVWHMAEDAAQHQAAITAIREAIAAGEVYQVNHTLRLHAQARTQASEHPLGLWHYHEALRQRQQARYSAWLDWGDEQVLSLSPELFFDWDRHTGHIVTRPMKGTAPRGATPAEDAAQAQALRSNTKERAENVMIVDLLRNDLGQIATTGSVQVPRLFTTEPYPTLWQMTSTVEATVRPETTLPDVLRALFPCGSITGAPKRKAMARIAGQEAEPRGVYCGAVGIVHPDRAVFNVAIRTVVADASGRLTSGVGSGITWSSNAQAEYAEAQLKACFLDTPPLPQPDFALFETLLLVDGRYALLLLHLDRIEASARAWNFRPVSRAQRKAALDACARMHSGGCWRVRLVQTAEGTLSTTATLLQGDVSPALRIWSSDGLAPVHWLSPPAGEALSAPPQPMAWADAPMPDTLRPWLLHKTTRRSHYDRASAPHPDAWDVLLYTHSGQVTETTRANMVLHTADGRWLTPPRTAGLLAGTLREALLQRGVLEEAPLPMERLRVLAPGETLWAVNSVRGWVRMAPPADS